MVKVVMGWWEGKMWCRLFVFTSGPLKGTEFVVRIDTLHERK